MTIVGYGDVVPHNPPGRVVGALMLLGTGFISQAHPHHCLHLVAADEDRDTRLDELVETVRRIEQRLDQLNAG